MWKELRQTLLVILLVCSLVWAQDYAFNKITVAYYVDFKAMGEPSSPAVGYVRWYQNSSTGLFSCINSSGEDCTQAPRTGDLTSTTLTSCPAGYTEYSALDGRLPLGTLAAHSNVGATGGSATVTPTGTNSTAAFTPAGTVAAPTFTGSSANTSAVTAGTPAGTNNAPALTMNSYTPAGTNGTVTGPAQVITWPVGVPTFAGTPFSGVINHTHTITVTSLVQGNTTAVTTGTHIMTSTATGGSARAPASGDSFTATSANPAGGVASITPAGTVAWPAGVPTNGTSTIPAETFTGTGAVLTGSVAAPVFSGSALGTHLHTLTATGTNSAPAFTGSAGTVPAQTWTGDSATVTNPYVRVIYCVKS